MAHPAEKAEVRIPPSPLCSRSARMDSEEIATSRLANQHISSVGSSGPVGVVASLGALQAQAYHAALWAIGLRCEDATQRDVEDVLAKKKIIRTWSMRGTWHFVPSFEVRWMLSLYPEEPIPSYQRRYGLTEQTLKKGLEIISGAFKKDKQLTYDSLGKILAGSGIPELKKTEVNRHIIRRAGRRGIICFSGYVGNQVAFRPLEEMVPKVNPYDRKGSLARFAKVYFESHGPATLQDFAWWSGLKMSDARAGLGMVKSGLREETLSGEIYWMPKKMRKAGRNVPSVYLLPSFDEYIIAYKDRSAALEPKYAKKVINGSMLPFLPMIISNGKVIGTWRHKEEKGKIALTLAPFAKLDVRELQDTKEAAGRFGVFVEREVSIR